MSGNLCEEIENFKVILVDINKGSSTSHIVEKLTYVISLDK